MKADANTRPNAPNELFWRVVVVVAATIPAAFLTWLGSSLSKDPSDFVRHWGFLLPCAVIAVPSALAFAADAVLHALDPGERSGAGPVVSLIASFVVFLASMFLVVD